MLISSNQLISEPNKTIILKLPKEIMLSICKKIYKAKMMPKEDLRIKGRVMIKELAALMLRDASI